MIAEIGLATLRSGWSPAVAGAVAAGVRAGANAVAGFARRLGLHRACWVKCATVLEFRRSGGAGIAAAVGKQGVEGAATSVGTRGVAHLAAGAAVVDVAQQVDFAAVRLLIVVAVREVGVASARANAGRAGGRADIVVGAFAAARRAVVGVRLQVGLTAIAHVAVAICEIGLASAGIAARRIGADGIGAALGRAVRALVNIGANEAVADKSLVTYAGYVLGSRRAQGVGVTATARQALAARTGVAAGAAVVVTAGLGIVDEYAAFVGIAAVVGAVVAVVAGKGRADDAKPVGAQVADGANVAIIAW